MSFPCTQCGECCRRTKFVSDDFLARVGLERGPDGICKHFNDNRCSIYETRPDVCRIPLHHYRMNAAYCNKWMTAIGRTDLITEDQLKAAGV